MLGGGHGPSEIIDVMSENHVMANVMTASFSQARLAEALKKELVIHGEVVRSRNLSV